METSEIKKSCISFSIIPPCLDLISDNIKNTPLPPLPSPPQKKKSKMKSKIRKAKFVHVRFVKLTYKTSVVSKHDHYSFTTNICIVRLHCQKQPPEVFCKKRCSYKFRKINRKTPVP